jgi:hypothetical protein
MQTIIKPKVEPKKQEARRIDYAKINPGNKQDIV